MATLNLKDMLKQYTVHNVQGLADKDKKSEGAGSYGTVYRVKVDGVPRIAKQLHEILLTSEVSLRERESIQNSFYQECLLLSELYHPNVVEFIGVHFGHEGNKVSLIMEHLHTDLDRFIDKERHPVVPVSIKASILLDVSYGLLYLHSMKPEPIVHRDLTARNILLTRDFRAKIADLGVAKLLNLEPNSPAKQTKCPGTLDYMPPEALKQTPNYGVELDIFSFGHLALCVAVQDAVHVDDISDCDPETLVDHIERHQLHILKRKVCIDSLLKNPSSCLRELIICCLNDKPEARPTAIKVSSVMKIVCDKFPKKPSDIVSVWNKFETAALEKDLPEDMKSIQELRNQLEEASTAKDKLATEKCSLEKNFEQVKRSNFLLANHLNDLTEHIMMMQAELLSTQKQLEKSEIALLNEYSEHDITKATSGEAREMFLTLISKVDKQLEHVLRERTRLDDLLTTTREEDGSTKEPKKMRRKRSKSDVSGEMSIV